MDRGDERSAEEPETAVVSVAAGEDRLGEHRGLGISVIAFKVTPHNASDLLILENTFHEPGGPPRHLHHGQDEVFYALEGHFLMEVGDARLTLAPGDLAIGPREVPQVWAFVGRGRGRILITFSPAGRMEAFFRNVTRGEAMPDQDPKQTCLDDSTLRHS